MKSNRIRVVVADKSEQMRKELAAWLAFNEDYELVGEARSNLEAIRLCHTLLPDVLLMDMVKPGTTEAAMMEAIGDAHPDIQIIAMTNFKDETLVRAALQVGSLGHLLRSVSMMESALTPG